MRIGSLIRHLPGYTLTLAVAALLFAFIVMPIGSVLIQSFYVSGPYSLPELRQKIGVALDRLEPDDRERSVKRWVETAKPQERMEAIAAALVLIEKPIP